MNKQVTVKSIFALQILFHFFPLTSYSQDIPCRDWYYITDRNGNRIKDKCKEAWQVNGDGQKHGKYIEYYENGNPSAVAMYRNGILHGSYTGYYEDGFTVWDKGNYVNGKKDGFWKEAKNSGVYKDGKTIGLWKFEDVEINFDTKEIAYHWNNLTFKSSLASGSISGELLFQFEFEKGDFRGYVTDRPNSVKLSVNEEAHAAFSSVKLSKYWSLDGQDYVTHSVQNTSYNFRISRVEFNRLIQSMKGSDGTPRNTLIALQFVNGNLNTNTGYKVLGKDGSPLGTIIFQESIRQEELLLKKRNQFLDSVQSQFRTYAKNGKLVHSLVSPDETDARISATFSGFKSRDPVPFNEYYKAAIDKELRDGSMLALSPDRYSGLVKIDKYVLSIMQAAGMKLTEETISRNYYLDYTIADGKFDGVQRIGLWSENMTTPKEGRVYADYVYIYDKGIKKSYKDVIGKREFAFNDKGEALDYQTLFHGIREIYEGLDGVREYEFKEYANNLFDRYQKMNNPEWARDTVFFYVLNYSNRSNDVNLLNKFYEEAKKGNVKSKYYQDYEWKILLAKGQLNEALLSLNTPLKASPNDGTLNYNKALIEISLKKYNESISSLGKIKSDENHLVDFAFAISYSFLGDKVKTRESIARFYSKANSRDYLEAKKTIEFLGTQGVKWNKLKFVERDSYGNARIDHTVIGSFLKL